MSFRRLFSGRCAQAVLLCWSLISHSVHAANWNASGSFRAGLTYSDNVGLGEDGSSDLIVRVAPRIQLEGTGRRLRVNLGYSPRFLTYLEDSDRSRVDHDLNLRAHAEWVEGHFFTDLRARVTQRLIDPRDSRGLDDLDVSGNRTDSISYQLSPYWQSRLGEFASVLARVRFNWVSFPDSTVSDTLSTQGEVFINGGEQFQRFRWGVSARANELDNSASRNNSFRSVRAQGTYRFTHDWQFRGSVGYEDNQINTAARSSTTGATWSASIIWNPHRRMRVELGWSSRSFSDSIFLNARWHHRRSVLSARYSESLTRVQLTELQFFGLDIVGFGVPGQPDIVIAVPRLTDEVLVRRRLNLQFLSSRRRGSLSSQLSIDQREPIDGGTEDTLVSASATWRYTLGRARSLSTSVRARYSDFGDSDRRDHSVTVSVGYNVGIWRGLNLRALLQHRRNDSDFDGADFTENRLTLSISGKLF